MTFATATLSGFIFKAIYPETWLEKFLDGLIGASAGLIILALIFFIIFLWNFFSVPARQDAELRDQIDRLTDKHKTNERELREEIDRLEAEEISPLAITGVPSEYEIIDEMTDTGTEMSGPALRVIVINNHKNKTVKNVSTTLVAIKKLDEQESKTEKPNLPLLSIGNKNLENIDPQREKAFKVTWLRIDGDQDELVFAPKPKGKGKILPFGEYELTIKVSAENIPPETKNIRLSTPAIYGTKKHELILVD